MTDGKIQRDFGGVVGIGLVFASWLIPGSGFMVSGHRLRGAAQFVMVMLTFGLGIALHSAVLWPTWSIRSEEFNLINNFTFIIQLGGGVPAIASYVASSSNMAGGALAALLGGEHSHPYHELGSYFLIVAGALNYFAACSFYDRVVSRSGRLDPQAGTGETEAS